MHRTTWRRDLVIVLLFAVLLLVFFAGIAGAFGAAPPATPQATAAGGYAAHYDPDVMPGVAARRGMPPSVCMVASPFYELGAWLIITSKATGATRVCQKIDMPRPEHWQRIVDKGIAIEFGWEITPVMCGITRPRQEPPSACPVTVARFAWPPPERRRPWLSAR